MCSISKTGLALVAAVALGVGIGLTLNHVSPALGSTEQGGMPVPGHPHYTVVETEGHNLIVTDNHANQLYFYTIDKGAEIGSELKLRGSVDLSNVGKAGLMPKKINIQK